MTVDLDELERLSGREPERWAPYFSAHGEPFVVPESMPFPSSQICAVSTSPDDYGRSRAILIAAARNALPELIALVRTMEECIETIDTAYRGEADEAKMLDKIHGAIADYRAARKP